jgi:hypothetical protein
MKNNRITIKESYKTIPHKHEPKHKFHLEEEQYMNIVRTFNKLLFEHLVKTGEEVQLLSKLGKHVVAKYRPKNKKIDFNATKKYGRTIYHRNYHTDGYAVKFMWRADRKFFTNKSFWAFKLTSSNQKINDFSLSKYIKENGVDHYKGL